MTFVCLDFLWPASGTGGLTVVCLLAKSGDEVWEDYQDQVAMFLGIWLSIPKPHVLLLPPGK